MRTIGHFIDGQISDGQIVSGDSGRYGTVFNPATGEADARVAFAARPELDRAVAAAHRAQCAWGATTAQRRARVLMRFVDLLSRDMEPLAELMSREHGKTIADSKGDIQRGLEVAEFCLGIAHLSKGAFTPGAGPAIDMYSLHAPVGVGAGITPFNFPAMIPLWMAMPAIACGNGFILKPSERDPSVPLRLAELLQEAGLPAGVFNVVHGDKETVDAILHHPDIQAVSFVGSTPVAAHVYATAAASGKRVQAFGGAKNHALILPDADMEMAADALVGAAYGSAGQRCMAISVAVPVGAGTADRLVAALTPKIERLRIGPYTDRDSDFGPVVTGAAKERILSLIARGQSEGAKLVIDGRTLSIQGYDKGFYVGPVLFDEVTADMDIYRTEIFGPVLAVVRAPSYEDALNLVNVHEYGNGAIVFTRDGDAARDFVARCQAGMVGVNVPIPTPLAYYGFGGWKRSAFGDLNQHGPDSIRFWTRTKTVTSRWPSGIREGAEFAMPVFAAKD